MERANESNNRLEWGTVSSLVTNQKWPCIELYQISHFHIFSAVRSGYENTVRLATEFWLWTKERSESALETSVRGVEQKQTIGRREDDNQRLAIRSINIELVSWENLFQKCLKNSWKFAQKYSLCQNLKSCSEIKHWGFLGIGINLTWCLTLHLTLHHQPLFQPLHLARGVFVRSN